MMASIDPSLPAVLFKWTVSIESRHRSFEELRSEIQVFILTKDTQFDSRLSVERKTASNIESIPVEMCLRNLDCVELKINNRAYQR